MRSAWAQGRATECLRLFTLYPAGLPSLIRLGQHSMMGRKPVFHCQRHCRCHGYGGLDPHICVASETVNCIRADQPFVFDLTGGRRSDEPAENDPKLTVVTGRNRPGAVFQDRLRKVTIRRRCMWKIKLSPCQSPFLSKYPGDAEPDRESQNALADLDQPVAAVALLSSPRLFILRVPIPARELPRRTRAPK